ncbi:hypothetical protein CSKR_104342 [Clonorchis sinensis]|uniref:Uncharacterized protein n=1 Tax=Clonorchis sinensis TaxID=79923 RepID=A0A419QDM0_CLOSI|nr:hypothetical protein CSKR_104342 [Clonorchis sinensis]
MAQWLECEFTDRKVRGSNPTPASRLLLFRLGQPGSIPALVLPSGGMAARYRKSVAAERLSSFFKTVTLVGHLKLRLGQPGSIPALVLPSGGMAARYRKSVAAERLSSFFKTVTLVGHLKLR